jgi:hypothetical protein
MFRKPVLRVAVLAALGFTMLVGFSQVQPAGWLQDYDRLGHIGGVPIEQVWVHPEFDVQSYRTLYVAPVQIDPLAYRRKGEQDHESAGRLAKTFRQVLNKELQESGIFPIVSTDPYFAPSRDGALTLQIRITEFNSGNPSARAWIGFGAGATEVQIEGKVIENSTCRTLVEFADRRLHPGGALLWGAKLAKNGEFLIGVDMKQILRGVVKLFVHLREEGPPAYQF